MERELRSRSLYELHTDSRTMNAPKNLKPEEVISLISMKIQLKKDMKEFKSNGQQRKAEIIAMKIQQLETKLHSRPLAKN